LSSLDFTCLLQRRFPVSKLIDRIQRFIKFKPYITSSSCLTCLTLQWYRCFRPIRSCQPQGKRCSPQTTFYRNQTMPLISAESAGR
jgi:hypothetical protein